MTVKLLGQLPKSYNGIDPIAEALLTEPKKLRVAIIFFDCPRIVEDTYAAIDSKEPIIRIKRIESIMGDDEEIVKEMLLRTYETRVGTDAIPFDAERDAKDNGTHEPLEIGFTSVEVIEDAEIIDDEPVHGAVSALKKADETPDNVTPIAKAKKARKKRPSKISSSKSTATKE